SLEVGEEPGPAAPPPASPEPGGEEEEEGEEGEGSEEEESNVICPPVLYYSREPAEPRLPPAAATGRWGRVVVGSPQEQGEAQSPPRPGAGPSLLHPSSLQQLHGALGQLPLLSTLLAEVSLLARCAAPADVHPHLAWLYQAPRGGGVDPLPPSPSRSPALKPAEVPVRPSGNSGAASPRFKQGQQEDALPETGSERNCSKTKGNRPPRRKLLYGLTNTLRLRLQQTNPEKLIVLERREQYRKKQMEMLKKRSPLSKRRLLKHAEKHVVCDRQCSKGDGSKQNGEVDETGGTSLQNSALKEYIASTGVSPDLQKEVLESLLRNSGIASREHPCKVTAASLVEESVLKSAHKEKDLKVQVPAAFKSDANTKGSNDNVVAMHLIHHKIREHDDTSVVSDHKQSPRRSVGKSSEFQYSDDFVASPDNTVYSEDFTSADCTGRELEALDSSPEPLWLESPKRPWSDTELESNRSRVSKASQRAESVSDLLPAHSASSPVHSLKRSHGLKSSSRTSGESVDLLHDASVRAGFLDEEQEAHQISGEENQVGRDIKQVSTLRSKRVSSDTDLNIGKGQTTAEKSQSITQGCSYLPCNLSDLELSDVENGMSDKDDDFLEELHVSSQYKDISELVISNLPGYTV
ncbi:MAP10 protein, partial [Alectura lathami]|nr:MAP10 protein [Alectura lathami]